MRAPLNATRPGTGRPPDGAELRDAPSPDDVPDRLPGIARHVTTPASGGRGPSIRALMILAISTLAFIATTPGAPTIERQVIGEVVLGGGGTVERELRIHVDPAAGDATRGSIALSLQAASGLHASYTREATLTLGGAADEEGLSRRIRPSELSASVLRIRASCARTGSRRSSSKS